MERGNEKIHDQYKFGSFDGVVIASKYDECASGKFESGRSSKEFGEFCKKKGDDEG